MRFEKASLYLSNHRIDRYLIATGNIKLDRSRINKLDKEYRCG